MDTIMFYIIVSLMFIFCIIMLVLSSLLYKHILPSAPERDLSVQSNIWPLTLAAEHFSESGQRIRTIGFKILWCCAGVIGVIISGIIVFLLVVTNT
ncbi:MULTISPECIES: hypothetical protein [Pseudoalteromonas]|uniref:Uncharacterized protein n=1 Tax=Pseudoalteromonas luteoviolacea (strain 2ta16) TaxID=1353533 RepID=V4HUD0_PSEL2|nr:MULTISPECIES: hypothetical protein [Pseudoalteromonas]ESP91524.1 hypothetical protein PL2TA16_00323 [Pseudoalteromonas luteoviolacea 2ta16]KZN40174.1 hypothetical protein N483_18465 [Pseudoalteromonas luteoviolacea NCIMB 1944]MCG7549257.1 hypothetical protein [Pseudoalteromonas sp. Of7M-16]